MNYILLIISYIIAGIHLYYKPELIPSHWDINGNVNAYMKYPWGIIIFPAFITLIFFLGLFLKKIDPFLKGNSKKWMPVISIVILLFILLQIYTLLYVFFTPKFNIFPLLFGIFFIIFGNYMPIIPRNGFIGIRTPWTLSSDIVWKKTHKFSGYTAIITGIISICISFTKYNAIAIYAIILWALLSTAYSFIVWKQIKKDN